MLIINIQLLIFQNIEFMVPLMKKLLRKDTRRRYLTQLSKNCKLINNELK